MTLDAALAKVDKFAREERIRDCMRRLGDRYRLASQRMEQNYPPEFSDRERDVMAGRRRLREWFEDRMEYLQNEYRDAINANDSIIGKQPYYDAFAREIKLPPR